MFSYRDLDPKWLDFDGNLKPNSWDPDSENPTHFNVQYFFTLEEANGGKLPVYDWAMLNVLIQNKWATQVDKEYRTNDRDLDNSFSLDESIAVAAACYRYRYPLNMSKLRIITKQTWFRFYDVIPFLILCKYPWTRWLGVLQCLVSFFACLSCLISKRARSTGRRKVYVICKGRKMDRLYKVCEYFNKLRGSSFADASFIYFPEQDHPINNHSRRIK